MEVRTFLTASGVVSLARSAAIRTLESRTSPRMAGSMVHGRLDGFFHVTREVLIDNRVCAAGFKRGYHFGDFPAFHLGSLEDGDRAAIPLDDDLYALPDFSPARHASRGRVRPPSHARSLCLRS